MSCQISPVTQSVFFEAAQVLKPPPRLTICAWAEREMVLSSEDSAEGGSRYRSERAPYQREMMDAILDPMIEEVVFMIASQCGKTLVMKNILGYFMKQDPSSIVWMVPTLDLAKKVSVQRLAPMFRDVPVLRNLMETGARKTGNSILEKSFPGGVLFLVGANSAASLSSMPIRIVLADEEDRYPASAGAEGSPIKLISARQKTYWNRKRVRASTPTDNASAIAAGYHDSDRRKFWVPCPHCSQFAGKLDGFQVFKWKRLVHGTAPAFLDCVYPCEFCGAALTNADKHWMLSRGFWQKEHDACESALTAHRTTHSEEVLDCKECDLLQRALDDAPAADHSVAGFWLSEMYSPFVSWSEMCEAEYEAKRHRENPNLMRVFVNTALAEVFEEEAEILDGSELMRRRESYPPPALPDGVTVLTAGVDVQQDRLEIEVVGWGKGEESWSVDVIRFDGDTAALTGTAGRPSPWENLDSYLRSARFHHQRGVYLPIAACFVDSGYRAQEVYAWTAPRNNQRVFASKGVSGFGRAPLSKWNRANRARAKLYPVAVDVLKETTYARLRIEEPGAGYMHFSSELTNAAGYLPLVEGTRLANDSDFFAQLTAEKIVSKPVRGYPVRHWELRVAGSRNEALDRRVYAYAAFLSLSERPATMLERLRKLLLAEARRLAASRHDDPNQLSLLEPVIPADEERGEDTMLKETTPVDELEVVRLLLDHVDYLNGACRVNEMIGAVLPEEILLRARSATGVVVRLLLDQVNYLDGACRANELVGAVLPEEIILNARKGLPGGPHTPSVGACGDEKMPTSGAVDSEPARPSRPSNSRIRIGRRW